MAVSFNAQGSTQVHQPVPPSAISKTPSLYYGAFHPLEINFLKDHAGGENRPLLTDEFSMSAKPVKPGLMEHLKLRSQQKRLKMEAADIQRLASKMAPITHQLNQLQTAIDEVKSLRAVTKSALLAELRDKAIHERKSLSQFSTNPAASKAYIQKLKLCFNQIQGIKADEKRFILEILGKKFEQEEYKQNRLFAQFVQQNPERGFRLLKAYGMIPSELDYIEIEPHRNNILFGPGHILNYHFLAKANLAKSEERPEIGNMPGVLLNGAFLYKVLASGTNFQGASMRETDLREARLIGANLQGVDFYRADLSGAHLEGADLRGAFNLTWTQLNKAHLDRKTLVSGELKKSRLLKAKI